MLLLVETLRPVRLPERREEAPVNGDFVVSGWGVTDTSESLVSDLNFASVSVITNEDCAAVYGNSIVTYAVLCTDGSTNKAPCNVSSLPVAKVWSKLVCFRVTVELHWFWRAEMSLPCTVL